MRRRINKEGAAVCFHCMEMFLSQDLHIDHRKRLADGGKDIDDNIQVLCRWCHHKKSVAEYHHSQ